MEPINSTIKWFVYNDITEGRITIKGFATDIPVAGNTIEAGRLKTKV